MLLQTKGEEQKTYGLQRVTLKWRAHFFIENTEAKRQWNMELYI